MLIRTAFETPYAHRPHRVKRLNEHWGQLWRNKSHCRAGPTSCEWRSSLSVQRRGQFSKRDQWNHKNHVKHSLHKDPSEFNTCTNIGVKNRENVTFSCRSPPRTCECRQSRTGRVVESSEQHHCTHKKHVKDFQHTGHCVQNA